MECTLNLEHFFLKNEPHSSCISEVTASERRAYLNTQKILFKRSWKHFRSERVKEELQITINLELQSAHSSTLEVFTTKYFTFLNWKTKILIYKEISASLCHLDFLDLKSRFKNPKTNPTVKSLRNDYLQFTVVRKC